MIIIRPYESADFPIIKQLFYDTVHAINAHDYSPEQLNAWAPKDDPRERMKLSLEENVSLIAEIDKKIVGFGIITRHGYIDYLFTHKDYQGQGIASALYKNLESHARTLDLTIVSTQASITARPFFAKQGFIVVKEQEVEFRGTIFTSYVMHKELE